MSWYDYIPAVSAFKMGKNIAGGGSSGGLNYQAERAPIEQATNLQQINSAYGNSQNALDQQRSFLMALQGQNGIGNQQNVFNQQQALANQLQGVANGTGPNPALAQLNQTTGQNVAAQAALMAGQRGTGSNAGLLARQIGQQGANIQQQAVGQGATLQAQQQLAAMSALQQQQGMMGNLAGQQVGQQANATLGYSQASQAEQNALLNAMAQYNNANVGMQSNINNANAGIAGIGAQGQNALLGGFLSGAGSAAMLLAKGGEVPSYEAGGEIGPSSFVGRFFKGFNANLNNQMPAPNPRPSMGGMDPGAEALRQGAGRVGKGLFKSAGGAIVQGKASTKGDSLKNDTVPALLSPKEIVIPRSITLSKDAPEKAKQFVAAILARNAGMKK